MLALAMGVNESDLECVISRIARADTLDAFGEWRCSYRTKHQARRNFIRLPCEACATSSTIAPPPIAEQLEQHSRTLERPASSVATRAFTESAALLTASCATSSSDSGSSGSGGSRGGSSSHYAATPAFNAVHWQMEQRWVLGAFSTSGRAAKFDLCVVEAVWAAAAADAAAAPAAAAAAAAIGLDGSGGTAFEVSLQEQLRDGGVGLVGSSAFVIESKERGCHHRVDCAAITRLLGVARAALKRRGPDVVAERISAQRAALYSEHGTADKRMALVGGCSVLQYEAAVQSLALAIGSGCNASSAEAVQAIALSSARHGSGTSGCAYKDDFMARLRYLYYDMNVSGAKLTQVMVAAWALWFDFPPPMGAVPDTMTVDRYMQRLHSVDLDIKYADVRESLSRAKTDGFPGGISCMSDASELFKGKGKTLAAMMDFVNASGNIGRARLLFNRYSGTNAEAGVAMVLKVLGSAVGLDEGDVDQTCSDGASVAINEGLGIQGKRFINGVLRPPANYHDDIHAKVLPANAAVEAGFGESGSHEDEHFQQLLYQAFLLSRADPEVARKVHKELFDGPAGASDNDSIRGDSDDSDDEAAAAIAIAAIEASSGGTEDASDESDDDLEGVPQQLKFIPAGTGNRRLPPKPNTGRWKAQAIAAAKHVSLRGYPLEDGNAAACQRAIFLADLVDDPTLEKVELRYPYPRLFISMAGLTRRWKRKGWLTLWRRCRDCRLLLQCTIVAELGLVYVLPSVDFNYKPGVFGDRQGHLAPDLFVRVLSFDRPFWASILEYGIEKALPKSHAMLLVLPAHVQTEMKLQVAELCRAGAANAMKNISPKLEAPWCFAALVHPETSQRAASALLEVTGARGATARVDGDSEMVGVFRNIGADAISVWLKVWNWDDAGVTASLHELAKRPMRSPADLEKRAKPMFRWALHYPRRWITSTLIIEIGYSQVKSAVQKNLSELAIAWRMHHLSDNAYAYRTKLREFIAAEKAKKKKRKAVSSDGSAAPPVASEQSAGGRGNIVYSKPALLELFRLIRERASRYTLKVMAGASSTAKTAAAASRAVQSEAFASTVTVLPPTAPTLFPHSDQAHSTSMIAGADAAVKLATPEGRRDAITSLIISPGFYGGGVGTPLKTAGARAAEIRLILGDAITTVSGAGEVELTRDADRVAAAKAALAKIVACQTQQRVTGATVTPLHMLIEWENTSAAAFIDDGGADGSKKPKPKTLFRKMCDEVND